MADVTLGPGIVDYDASPQNPGDTIYLQNGNYTEIWFENIAGTEANPITITNVGGLVDFTGAIEISFRECHNFRLMGNGVGGLTYGIKHCKVIHLYDHCKYFELAWLEGHTGHQCIHAKDDWDGEYTMEHVYIHNNYMHDGTGEAIYIGDSHYPDDVYLMNDVYIYDNLIEDYNAAIQVGSCWNDCYIYDNVMNRITPQGDPHNTHAAICINHGTEVVCHGNVVRDCNGNGILQNDAYRTHVFYQNLLVDCGHTLVTHPECIKSYGDYNDFYNNTIIGADDYGIQCAGWASHDQIYNNIILDTVNASIEPGNNPGGQIHHNDTKEEGYVAATYGFVNEPAGDYHLALGCDAIDAGVDAGLPYLGAAPDLGYAEYGSGGGGGGGDTLVHVTIMVLNPPITVAQDCD